MPGTCLCICSVTSNLCALHDECASCHGPLHAPSTAVYIVQAPFAAVVAFGLYSTAAVLYGVFTFRDCPEEAASLHKVATSHNPAHQAQAAYRTSQQATATARCADRHHITAVTLCRT